MTLEQAGGRRAEQLAALIEVVSAFAFVHLSYRSFKQFTELGRQEVAAGLNFSPGAVMILFTLTLLLSTRRSFDDYGLTLHGWRYQLNVGLFWSLLIVLAAGIIARAGLVHIDPLHPPDLAKAAVFSIGAAIMTLVLVVFLRRERSLLRHLPSWASFIILMGLVLLPVVLAVLVHRDVLNMLLRVAWLFLGAGVGEEVFFRGYIQSRVNQSFGRPWRVLGLQFGVGLFISSLLFGFIHALNTVDYFNGRFEFAWLWWATNFATGLFFGCLREGTGSILPGAVVHGLEDVLAEVPGLLG
jgi:membrane protease YdiL (CAAX protease family)